MSPQNSIFVDTSGWAAPVMKATPEYLALRAFSTELIQSGRPLLTTNYVITEVVALLTNRSPLSRPQILAFTNQIKSTAQVIHIDPALDAAAWAMLEQYDDKDWSLVDAASFVVMRQLGITEAFTSDQHFTQAGYVRLPII